MNGPRSKAEEREARTRDALQAWANGETESTLGLAWLLQATGTAQASPGARELWQPQPGDRFSVSELETLPPPPRFVLRPYLPEGVPAVLQGAGGTSKTGLLMAMAVGICTGRPLVGEVPEPGAVLLVSAEDRRDAVQRHLHAATRELPRAALEAVATRLVVKDAVGLGVKLTRSVSGELLLSGDLRALCDYAATLPDLRLVILDTLSRLHGGEETNEGMAAFVEGMEAICRRTGAACVVAHHTGKAQARADMADQYGGRGGSALSDNARSVLHLAAVTAETKGAPVNAGELIAERRLLRLSHVKCNAAALAPDVWLERVQTEGAGRLEVFAAEFGKPGPAAVWAQIEEWLSGGGCSVAFPSKDRVASDAQASVRATRAQVRDAVAWALEVGRLEEAPHPRPRGALKTYVRLPEPADYEATRRGD